MRSARILIIDRSADTRAMYADYFRYHGYRVAEAADGEEAVRVAARLRPGLVVTELSDEPEWLDALRVLRRPAPERGAEAAETAVIACSTRIDRSTPFAPAGVDVDLALPKPLSPRSLLLEAERLLKSRALATAAAR